MFKIENRKQLLSHGSVQARDYAIRLAEYAIEAVDSYKATRRLVKREGDQLLVNGRRVDLRHVNRIYVIGAGKATAPIARALEEILRDQLTAGVIVVKYGHGEPLTRVRVIEARHPLPDRAGYRGALEVASIADRAGRGDLVFCTITGGASALLPMPARGISLEEEIEMNRLLLTSGASISEINTVRNHISSIKGGRLAIRVFPAELVNLMVIDEPEDRPWGPTVPDQSTFEDAIEILRRYHLWHKIPQRVKAHLQRGLTDKSLETPKNLGTLKFQNVILGNNKMACQAVRERASQLGLDPIVVDGYVKGESKEAGRSMAAFARSKRPRYTESPLALIFGGETVVTISGKPGLGGPSQELALSFAREIAGEEETALLAMDTDGTDGPTDVAGGLVDGKTMNRAEKLGLEVAASLNKHNAYDVLAKLQDTVVTGPTGTNVMDLNIVVMIGPKSSLKSPIVPSAEQMKQEQSNKERKGEIHQ